MQDKSNHLG
jgi:hypothetical protein